MSEITKKHRVRKRKGFNPVCLKNLHPFKKGASGNPNGKPAKPICVTSWLKEYANQRIVAKIDPATLTYAQAAALSAWKAAAKGDLAEYNFIIDRLEGKVVQQQQIDLTTKGKGLNEQPNIPIGVIDQAMAILYASDCDSPPFGDSGTAEAEPLPPA